MLDQYSIHILKRKNKREENPFLRIRRRERGKIIGKKFFSLAENEGRNRRRKLQQSGAKAFSFFLFFLSREREKKVLSSSSQITCVELSLSLFLHAHTRTVHSAICPEKKKQERALSEETLSTLRAISLAVSFTQLFFLPLKRGRGKLSNLCWQRKNLITSSAVDAS